MKWTLSCGFLVATCLTLLLQTAFSQAPVTNLSSLYAPADEWTDASKLDWIPAQQGTMRNIYVPQSAAEWTDLGHVDSRAVLGNTDGQVAVQITPHSGTAFGVYRHFIFGVEPDNPGDMWNHTYYTEMNILEATNRVSGFKLNRGEQP
jgi:hypothetical protein